MNKNFNVRKIVISGILIAISTVLGTLSIPFFGGKMSPVQHFVNVIAAVILGPVYSVVCAFVTSVLRNIFGTGSLLAFPGSMIGALLSGLIYKYTNKKWGALVGEIIGTGIIGSLAAYPVAVLVMGKNVAAFTYVIPFLISCTGGAVIAYILLKLPVINSLLDKEQKIINAK